MESKKINQLATELTPALSDLTIIGDPTTGISKKITLSQMASLFTGTVEEYANLAAFPLVGVADTIYIALDTNVLYRWNTGTNAYVELSPNIINSLVFSDANGFDGNISLVGSVATLTITTALTTGSVPFIGASGALSQDNANLFFDDTNNRLGVNTNVPTTALDVFGSGIIGRLNGTSTNNAFLGFASAGTNKWSIGNVQSDHRFRIYNEATTSELVSVLQTGEFGIGIANPLTKLHIFGGASALIANLDANTSVAKSISFRSGNSSRINLEVSGTESGSNAGANFYLRTYTDAGALLATPITITRSTGAITLATALSGTSATFSGITTISNATNSTSITTGALVVSGGLGIGGATFLGGNLEFASGYFINMPWVSDTRTIWERYNSATYFQRISSNAGARQLRLESNGAYGNASIVLDGQSNSTVTTSITSDQTYISGNLGVGTITPNRLLEVLSGGLTYLRVTGNRGNSDDLHVGNIEFYNSNTSRIIAEVRAITGTGGTQSNSGQLAFYTNNAGTYAERMRITSGGQVNVNSTQTTYPFYVQAALGNWTSVFENTANGGSGILMRSTGGSQGYYYGAYDGGAYKFFVNGSGVVNSTSTSITIISSDIKLKTDIRDYNKGLAEVLAMKPRIYKRKDNLEIDEVGFIAQEMDIALAGSMIESYKDEEGEPIYTYQLEWYPLLVKAIQEQQAQIEELKALINK